MARRNIPEDFNLQRHCCENTIRMFCLIIYFAQTFLSRCLIPSYSLPPFRILKSHPVVLGAFANLRKAANSRTFVRPHGTTRLTLKGFSQSLIFGYFLKSA